MAKALGLIGNFKGKLGNTVGYSLKDSNNKQTQGVRVYQPVVRNPKTAAQAEQRAKLAPINATYRALKMVIDRGQEGKAYGNKSRLAFLKSALKNFDGIYALKGDMIEYPALVQVANGSLSCPIVRGQGDSHIGLADVQFGDTLPTKVGPFATAVLATFPSLKAGDQLTFICTFDNNGILDAEVQSVVLDTESEDNLPFTLFAVNGVPSIIFHVDEETGGCVILSREGNNGEHLRSTASIVYSNAIPSSKRGEDWKKAAIESYMSQGANTDWAEESLM